MPGHFCTAIRESWFMAVIATTWLAPARPARAHKRLRRSGGWCRKRRCGANCFLKTRGDCFESSPEVKDGIKVAATSAASADELKTARLGTRFGRLDLCSRLAVLAVEKLGIDFASLPRERIGIC